MTSTQTILQGIPSVDHSVMALAANRRCNMAGWRYSDALRAERADYESLGRLEYLSRENRGREIVRGLGY